MYIRNYIINRYLDNTIVLSIQFVSRIARPNQGERPVGRTHLTRLGHDFPDKDIDACLPHDRLESEDVVIRRPAKCTAWERIERYQIDLAADAADEFDEAQRIRLAIVHAGEQDILKCQPSMWR